MFNIVKLSKFGINYVINESNKINKYQPNVIVFPLQIIIIRLFTTSSCYHNR